MARSDALSPSVRMQRRVGCKLPVVWYIQTNSPPNDALTKREVDHMKWQEQFSSIRFQPTAGLLYYWGALSPQGNVAMSGIKRVIRERSLDAACFDTLHGKIERSGHIMPDWEETLSELVCDGTVREKYVCTVRPHMGGRADELNLILDDQVHCTEIWDMLSAVRENLPVGQAFDVVLEMPAEATRDDIGKP